MATSSQPVGEPDYVPLGDSKVMDIDDPRIQNYLAECRSAAIPGNLDRFVPLEVPAVAPPGPSVQRPFRLAHFVFQGGGLLGIAHLGFLRAMEHVGIRAVGLAGTSAGAILALLICTARGNHPLTSVSAGLTKILWRMPASGFIDGPYASRRLIKHVLGGGSIPSLEMSAPLLGSLRKLIRTFGLNKGLEFESWLDNVLRNEHRVTSVGEIECMLDNCARFHQIDAGPDDMLKINATALPLSKSGSVPAGIKFTFPRDMNLLAERYRRGTPALMARASMSVPFFFEPLTCDLDHANWKQAVPDRFTHSMDAESLELLRGCDEVAFVDGGLLSNFPVDSFRDRNSIHGVERSISSVPTIGVTLTSSIRAGTGMSQKGIDGLTHYVSAVLDGMRHSRDREAAQLALRIDAAKKLSNVRIAAVDVGSHNWLNFRLEDSDKEDLYLRGIRGARDFLLSLP